MASDEQLRMIATLTDGWSKPLKDMQRSLRSLVLAAAASLAAIEAT
jgi:hypothetical protein